MRDRLAIGIVRRSHGTAGYVHVRCYSGQTSHLSGVPEVYLEPGSGSRTVEDVRQVRDGILLKLHGVDGREEADLLLGSVVWVDRVHASPLVAGEFYVGDLCGCEVLQGSRRVGFVQSFVDGGATGLMEVKGESGRTFLVPFIDECVGEVSVERRIVELREGFEIP